MNFEIVRNFEREIVLKQNKLKPNPKEVGSFASNFYKSYENLLTKKVTDEMISEATQGKEMSFSASMRLGRQLKPTIIAKVEEKLRNENREFITWQEDVEVIQEIHSNEGQKLLKAHKKEREDLRRDLKDKRRDMKIDIILSELESLGITDTQILHKMIT